MVGGRPAAGGLGWDGPDALGHCLRTGGVGAGVGDAASAVRAAPRHHPRCGAQDRPHQVLRRPEAPAGRGCAAAPAPHGCRPSPTGEPADAAAAAAAVSTTAPAATPASPPPRAWLTPSGGGGGMDASPFPPFPPTHPPPRKNHPDVFIFGTPRTSTATPIVRRPGVPPPYPRPGSVLGASGGSGEPPGGGGGGGGRGAAHQAAAGPGRRPRPRGRCARLPMA